MDTGDIPPPTLEDFEDELIWDNSGEHESRLNSPVPHDEERLPGSSEITNSQLTSPRSVRSAGQARDEFANNDTDVLDENKPDDDLFQVGADGKDLRRAISPIRWDENDNDKAALIPDDLPIDAPKLELATPAPMTVNLNSTDVWCPFFKDTRFFLMKSNNYENIAIAKERQFWSTTKGNESRINEAFFEYTNVILVFSVKESGKFQGFARVVSASDPRVKVPWVLPPRMSPDILSSPFKLDWISKIELPFTKTVLTNPWNENKPIKIGRDGQEIEFRAGEALCSLFPYDHTCDVAQALFRVRPCEVKRDRRREDRRNVPRLPQSNPRSTQLANSSRLLGVQPSSGAGLLGSVGGLTSMRNQFPGDRRSVNQNSVAAPPLIQVNAAMVAMAAASALAAISSSGQSTLANAIARNSSAAMRLPSGMPGLRPSTIAPLMSSLPATSRVAGLLNTPNAFNPLGSDSNLPNLLPHNIAANPVAATAFARALQMSGINSAVGLRRPGVPGTTVSSILPGVVTGGAGGPAAQRRFRSPPSGGNYGSADPVQGRHTRDTNYYSVDNSNSRPLDASRAASIQRLGAGDAFCLVDEGSTDVASAA